MTVALPALMSAVGPASPGDLIAARWQMAISLGWHIIVACLGVAFPALLLFTEWRAYYRRSAYHDRLALRWAKGLGVLFAIGAVSGTILSFEMGLLWPAMMGTYGQVIGLPFALEGVAFFTEAIFIGIYLYGRNRLPPLGRVLSVVPIAIAGPASAFLVVTANAWMNEPQGFTLDAAGRVISADPWAAMFNRATAPQVVHMIVAAFMVTGFTVAGVYAVAMLRGRRDRYHRLGFLMPFTMAAVATPIQIVVGDWAARSVAERQPAKLAAMEALFRTGKNVPLSLGGVVVDGELRYALEIPNGLSLLVGRSPDTVIPGLDRIPVDERPPVMPVHLAFNVMVLIGFFLLFLSLWFAVSWWRRRDLPRSRLFLYLTAVSGVAAIIAVETGWIVTEVGRQPWTVYGHLRTVDAVNPAPGLWVGFVLVCAVYLALTVGSVYVLRLLTRGGIVAPQEAEEPRRFQGQEGVR